MRYKGSVISATAPTISANAAIGVWTLQQQLQAIAAGNWPPLIIGQAFGGGYYAGQISTSANSVATHYLIVGPLASAQSSGLKWKNANTATTGADSDIDGPQNTADMVAGGSSTVYPAAWFCDNLTIGSYTDWYLPAKNELEVCYYNLKPDGTGNNTSSGINDNAVPARTSNYTSGTPAQTSAAAFQTDGGEAFLADFYWSSTEASNTTAWLQRFATGRQVSTYPKASANYLVRAIRRVAV
jgi:hypothetical protein